MKDIYDLKKLGRVKAPPGFETACLETLSGRKRRHVKEKYIRLSLAGAFCTVLIAALIVGVFILPQGSQIDLSSLEKPADPGFRSGFGRGAFNIIHITEPVGYVQEIRNFSREVPTIYILEKVSDQTDTKIKY